MSTVLMLNTKPHRLSVAIKRFVESREKLLQANDNCQKAYVDLLKELAPCPYCGETHFPLCNPINQEVTQ